MDVESYVFWLWQESWKVGNNSKKNCPWDYNSITCKLKKKEEEQGRRKKKMKKKKLQTPNEGLVIVPTNAHLSLNARASDQERAMHLIPTRRQGELDFLHTFKFWPSVNQYWFSHKRKEKPTLSWYCHDFKNKSHLLVSQNSSLAIVRLKLAVNITPVM